MGYLEQLEQKLVLERLTKIGGLEVYLDRAEVPVYRLVVLEKLGDEVNIVQKAEFSDPEQMPTDLIKELPFSVVLTGNHVLSKKIGKSSDEALSSKELVGQTFPNIDPSDFFVQTNNNEADATFLSIVRNTQLKEAIDPLMNAGLWVTDIGIGPFCGNTILPYLEKKPNDYIHLGNYTFELKDGILINFSKKGTTNEPKQVGIGTESIEETYLIAFAQAFINLGLQKFSSNFDLPGDVKKSRERFIYKKLLAPSFKLAIGLIGAIFVVNLGAFAYLNTQKTSLRKETKNIEGQLNHLDSLNQNIKERRQFLEKTQWVSLYPASFVADRLANSKPVSVKFNLLNIHPLKDEQQYQGNEEFQFETNQTLLTGETSNPQSFSEWAKNLQQKEWIENVAIINLEENNDENTATFKLKIELKLRDA